MLSASLAEPAAALEICHTPTPNPAALTERAEAAGFAALPTGADLPPLVAERLPWVLAQTYLAGDSGGQSLDGVMASQSMSARGMVRLAPSDTASTRVVFDAQTVAVLRWVKWVPGEVMITCVSAHFTASDAPQSAEPTTTYRYGILTSTALDPAPARTRVRLNQFDVDRAAILADLPGSNPPHALLSVEMRYNPEVSQ